MRKVKSVSSFDGHLQLDPDYGIGSVDVVVEAMIKARLKRDREEAEFFRYSVSSVEPSAEKVTILSSQRLCSLFKLFLSVRFSHCRS